EAMFGREAAAICLNDIAAARNADQRVMRLILRFISEIRFVGRDERNVMRIGKVDQRPFGVALAGRVVALEFDIEAVAKNLLQAHEKGFGSILVAMLDEAVHDAIRPACQADQAFGILREAIKADLCCLPGLWLKKSEA